MKILIKECGIESYNLTKAFKFLEFNVALWGGPTSSFDVFDSFEPDVFICNGDTLDISMVKCLKERPYVKTLIKVSNNSAKARELSVKYPIKLATKREIYLIDIIKPFLYTSNQDVELSGYSNINKVLNSADPFQTYGESVKSDVVYYGIYDKRNGLLNDILYKLCEDFRYNIKIFGPNKFPLSQFCGNVPNENIVRSGAIINLNIGEICDVIEGFEVPTSLYNNYFNKYFTISTAYTDTPAESFISIKDLMDKIEFYVKNPENRNTKTYYEYALNNTSLHRASQILEIIGEDNCQQKVSQFLKRFY